jgi:hypothetical protein
LETGPSFDVITDNGTVATTGAAARLGFELRTVVRDPQLTSAVCEALRGLAALGAAGAFALEPGGEIDWSTWRLRALTVSGGALDLGEAAPDDVAATVHGIDFAVGMWLDQAGLCEAYGSAEVETRFGDLIAVSPGALAEGAPPIEGIRSSQRRGDGASGWYLFDEAYDARVDGFASMERVEAGRVLERRPYVAKFLALACGFCFRVAPDGARRIWRDRLSG